MKKQFQLLIWTIGIVVLLIVGGWWLFVDGVERDARTLFEQALHMQVGVAAMREVLGVVNKSPGKKYGFDECFAGHDGCLGTVYVQNTWLSRLHLAPPIAFAVRLGVSNRILTNREFIMILGDMYGEGTHGEAFANERVGSPGVPSFDIHEVSFEKGVNMTSEATPDQKGLAYDFNFDCLVQIRGCKDYGEMLPILKRTGSR